MPANVTHMLIAHKALQTLKAKGVAEFAQFAQVLDNSAKSTNYKAYVNLGSLGPDLYYYARMSSSIKDMLQEGFVQARGVTPWSYHLHSHRPNEFPLRLVQIVFSDAIRENGQVELYDEDIKKLAYVAGPYYREGQNRRKQRECEVFQDYFRYDQVYRLEDKSGSQYDFFKQDFRGWADCVRGMTTRNTEDWFRYFLQRGFVETYSACPSEEDTENSVDDLLLTLRACRQLGPYKKADREYRRKGRNSKMYQQYIREVAYIKFYRLAVELAVIYLSALYEVYFVLRQGKDFTNRHKKRFLSIVSDADLSCPLEQKIFEKARAALRNKRHMAAAVKMHTPDLPTQTKLLTSTRIFKAASDKDLLKA